MKKQMLKKILFAFVILTLGSCSDSIFYTISQEEKQLEPLIKGSPTNFVDFNGNMYVGSGATLYRYNGTSDNPARGDWTPSTPGGDILQLAATGSKMYALCDISGNRILKEFNGTAWNIISVPVSVQSIYAANDQLFIGAGTYGSYSIYHLNAGKTLTGTGNKLLNGAAADGSTYYLSAKDMNTESSGGIYSSDLTEGGTSPVADLTKGETSPVADKPFMGIINIGNTIIAISRNGVLYKVTDAGVDKNAGVDKKTYTLGDKKLATGALAIWTDPVTSRKLLLAGRQDEMKNSVNYLHGYQELELEAGDIKSGAVFRDPGLFTPTTVDNNATYKTNMEKNPVNFLFQAPKDGILFASTQKNGVWSYRPRYDKWQWNSEQ